MFRSPVSVFVHGFLLFAERCFKYVFHFLCGVATVGFTIYCVHQYIKDEDVARIEFAEFNAEEDNIYPTAIKIHNDKMKRENISDFCMIGKNLFSQP